MDRLAYRNRRRPPGISSPQGLFSLTPPSSRHFWRTVPPQSILLTLHAEGTWEHPGPSCSYPHEKYALADVPLLPLSISILKTGARRIVALGGSKRYLMPLCFQICIFFDHRAKSLRSNFRNPGTSAAIMPKWSFGDIGA